PKATRMTCAGSAAPASDLDENVSMSVEISGVSCRNGGGALPSARPDDSRTAVSLVPRVVPESARQGRDRVPLRPCVEEDEDARVKEWGVGRAPPRSIGRAMSWAPT